MVDGCFDKMKTLLFLHRSNKGPSIKTREKDDIFQNEKLEAEERGELLWPSLRRELF